MFIELHEIKGYWNGKQETKKIYVNVSHIIQFTETEDDRGIPCTRIELVRGPDIKVTQSVSALYKECKYQYS